MTFTHFIKETAPKYCGVHPSYGEIARLVHESEMSGNSDFSASVFKNTRDRAKMYLPYGEYVDSNKYGHVVDMVEYGICFHRQDKHGEDHNERIGQLSERLIYEAPEFLEAETLEVATRGWWNL